MGITPREQERRRTSCVRTRADPPARPRGRFPAKATRHPSPFEPEPGAGRAPRGREPCSRRKAEGEAVRIARLSPDGTWLVGHGGVGRPSERLLRGAVEEPPYPNDLSKASD